MHKLKPKDFVSFLGIKGNTIRPILKKLKDGFIIRSDDEGYWIPNINLVKIKELLKEREKENK